VPSLTCCSYVRHEERILFLSASGSEGAHDQLHFFLEKALEFSGLTTALCETSIHKVVE